MGDGLSFSKTIFIVPLQFAICCSLLVLPSLLLAQERGKVEVVKDQKVDSLIEKYLVDKREKTGTTGTAYSVSTDGYRVQIYSGAERKAAYDAQAKFREKFPDERTYISYVEPDFKVRVGDFRTRLEAEKMANELKSWFSGLFIIPEKVTPKVDEE
jgi:hypothetical protein